MPVTTVSTTDFNQTPGYLLADALSQEGYQFCEPIMGRPFTIEQMTAYNCDNFNILFEVPQPPRKLLGFTIKRRPIKVWVCEAKFKQDRDDSSISLQLEVFGRGQESSNVVITAVELFQETSVHVGASVTRSQPRSANEACGW